MCCSPNFCDHFPSGFTPAVLSAPDWETERIYCGVHSLCQRTLEATLNHTQGPPSGQAASTPTRIPIRGRPHEPPQAYAVDHSNPRPLPEGGAGVRRRDGPTSPSDTLLQVRGPFTLALQGTDVSTRADLTVSTLKTNGLMAAKLT